MEILLTVLLFITLYVGSVWGTVGKDRKGEKSYQSHATHYLMYLYGTVPFGSRDLPRKVSASQS